MGLGDYNLWGLRAYLRSTPPIDVRAYGALGDGVTDDAVAIQAAVTAGAAQGRRVRFPFGTYIIGTTITVPSNSTLVNNGKIKAKASLVGQMFYMATRQNVWFLEGEYDGSTAALGTIGFDFYQSTSCGLKDVTIHDTIGSGVELRGTIGSHCDNIVVDRLYAYACQDRGIKLSYCDNSIIIAPTMATNGLGIGGGACSNVSIIGGLVTGSTQDGIAFGDSEHILYIGVISKSNGAEGLNLENCSYSEIVACTSELNLLGIAVQNPAALANGHNNTVVGNTVLNATQHGLYIVHSQYGNVVTGNTVKGSGTNGAMLAVQKHLVFTGNTLEGKAGGGHGIEFQALEGGTIAHNTCYRNPLYGIEEGGFNSSSVSVKDNTIQENGDGGATYKYGVHIHATNASIFVDGNTFVDLQGAPTQLSPIYDDATGWVRGNHSVGATTLPIVSLAISTDNDWNFAGAAPATGTWAVGSRVYNNVPGAGLAVSWVCTAAGTPGTWMAELWGPVASPTFTGIVTAPHFRTSTGTIALTDGAAAISIGYTLVAPSVVLVHIWLPANGKAHSAMCIVVEPPAGSDAEFALNYNGASIILTLDDGGHIMAAVNGGITATWSWNAVILG